MVTDSNGEVWLTSKEAAEYLGLSYDRIRHLKRYLTHRKGTTRESRVYFCKSTLFDDYLATYKR